MLGSQRIKLLSMNAWEMFIENQSTQNYIIKCLLCHSEIKPSVIKHDRNTIFVCKKKKKKNYITE